MPSKQYIFDNIEQYDAANIAAFINQGIFTYDELMDNDDAAPLISYQMRRELKQLLAQQPAKPDPWLEALQINTAQGYADYLRNNPDGQHRDEARQQLRALQAQPAPPPVPEPSSDPWDEVDKNNIDALYKFKKEYPASSHITECKKLIVKLEFEDIDIWDITRLKKEIAEIEASRDVMDPAASIYKKIIDLVNRKKITTDAVLAMIADDHNVLSSAVVRQLIDNGHLTPRELIQEAGIDKRFVSALASDQGVVPFDAPDPLKSIDADCTEVYFWGIPSSGKSCALGAILSAAGNGRVARSMKCMPGCQGYDYMNRLSQLFKNNGKVSSLPAGTPTLSTYAMTFELEDREKGIHPITCVDLAGELLSIIYKKEAGKLLDDVETMAYDTLRTVLIDQRSNNRKIHFFVIEYGGDARNYYGLPQDTYLANTLNFIENAEIFKDNTDAIYLFFTKADKAKVVGDELGKVLAKYTTDNYLGFYQGLERLCRENQINNGRVERMPFTLGEVCFQDYCLFDESAAQNVVNRLIDRSAKRPTGFMGKIRGGLSH